MTAVATITAACFVAPVAESFPSLAARFATGKAFSSQRAATWPHPTPTPATAVGGGVAQHDIAFRRHNRLRDIWDDINPSGRWTVTNVPDNWDGNTLHSHGLPPSGGVPHNGHANP